MNEFQWNTFTVGWVIVASIAVILVLLYIFQKVSGITLSKGARKLLVMCGIGIVPLVIISLMVIVGDHLRADEPNSAINLPILTIVGVVALLGILTAVTVAFSALKLADPKQALGLPEGSVRAAIALCLIMIFAIVAIYFYSDQADDRLQKAEDLSEQSARNLITTNLQPGEQLFVLPPLPKTPTSPPTQFKLMGKDKKPLMDKANHSIPDFTSAQDVIDYIKTYNLQEGEFSVDPPIQKYSVYWRLVANPASVDFAKQVLTALITLITAISSFYFGARTAAPSTSSGGDKSATDSGIKIEGPDTVSKNATASYTANVTGN